MPVSNSSSVLQKWWEQFTVTFQHNKQEPVPRTVWFSLRLLVPKRVQQMLVKCLANVQCKLVVLPWWSWWCIESWQENHVFRVHPKTNSNTLRLFLTKFCAYQRSVCCCPAIHHACSHGQLVFCETESVTPGLRSKMPNCLLHLQRIFQKIERVHAASVWVVCCVDLAQTLLL